MSKEDLHALEDILVPKEHEFRITFVDGDVAVLTRCEPTDTYLEDTSPRWTSVVVRCDHAPSDKAYVYEPGNGLDFHEGDVRQIFDMSVQKLIYDADI